MKEKPNLGRTWVKVLVHYRSSGYA